VWKVIANLLKGDPEIDLVAECVSFAQTIEIAAKLIPQAIVLDVQMGDEHTVTPSQVKSGHNGSRLLAI
jgi:chemotaxis response regulator CheB